MFCSVIVVAVYQVFRGYSGFRMSYWCLVFIWFNFVVFCQVFPLSLSMWVVFLILVYDVCLIYTYFRMNFCNYLEWLSVSGSFIEFLFIVIVIDFYFLLLIGIVINSCFSCCCWVNVCKLSCFKVLCKWLEVVVRFFLWL